MQPKKSVQTTRNDELLPMTGQSTERSLDLSFENEKGNPRKQIYTLDLSGKSRIIETGGQTLVLDNQ